jgi:hypothetical protein
MTAVALALAAGMLQAAHAQEIVRGYGAPPPPPPGYGHEYGRDYGRDEVYLGHAHVDGPVDHDNIRVDRYAGRFHAIILRVDKAPIQFDRVVIHYGDGEAQILPVNAAIPPGGNSRWINLPGGERRIRSIELWYARAQPDVPVKPEVQLFGR